MCLCQVFVVAHGIFSCSMQALSGGMWDLVPLPGIKPEPPALGARSLSHWTTREVPAPWDLELLLIHVNTESWKEEKMNGTPSYTPSNSLQVMCPFRLSQLF